MLLVCSQPVGYVVPAGVGVPGPGAQAAEGAAHDVTRWQKLQRRHRRADEEPLQPREVGQCCYVGPECLTLLQRALDVGPLFKEAERLGKDNLTCRGRTTPWISLSQPLFRYSLGSSSRRACEGVRRLGGGVRRRSPSSPVPARASCVRGLRERGTPPEKERGARTHP